MSPPIPVTDHALVRYMERVMGLPVEEVREEIAALVAAKVQRLERDESCLVEAHGFLYAIRKGWLVTVIPGRPPRKARRRVPGELPAGGPREPGSRPATDDDPWWFAAAGGP